MGMGLIIERTPQYTGTSNQTMQPTARVYVSFASYPLAALSLPVVLEISASTPMAVFSRPVVLLKSASTPMAVLELPVVL